jgi:hypothetical protein
MQKSGYYKLYLILVIFTKYGKIKNISPSLSRDLNTGPADYKSAALPTKPLRRHTILSFDGKKDGARNGCFPASNLRDRGFPREDPDTNKRIQISYTPRHRLKCTKWPN